MVLDGTQFRPIQEFTLLTKKNSDDFDDGHRKLEFEN